MIRKRVDSKLERQFIIAMATSKPFLSGMSATLDPDLLQVPYLRRIAEWCLEYFREYGKAPGKNLEPLFHSWVETESPKEDDAEAVGDFLDVISKEHQASKKINVAYLMDEASKYLTLKKVALLKDTLDTCLLRSNQEDALSAITGFNVIDMGADTGSDPMNKRDPWDRAFAEPPEPVIKFNGDAGRFLNTALVRDSLVSIQAPEKRGKTFFCTEMALQAIRSHSRVAMFQVGDLSESQFIRRLGVRLAGIPMWRNQLKGVQYPTSLRLVEGEDGPEGSVTFKTKSFKNVITMADSWRARRRFMQHNGILPHNTYFMLSVHANSSINVRGIGSILDRWRHQLNFIPDVVIIDYADILAPEDSREEHRHQVNSTWKALRRLSQERHCLVIAPTQAAASSYTAKTQKMGNFSEDKRKFAHVTGCLGLNQTEPEKEKQLMRLNWILMRENVFHPNQCLHVAQCLALGRPMVISTLK